LSFIVNLKPLILGFFSQLLLLNFILQTNVGAIFGPREYLMAFFHFFRKRTKF